MNNYPIRVLCVFSTLDRGGAETMCMNLYRHIDRNKVQFDFVKHTSKIGDYEKEILVFGGKIFEAPKLKASNYFEYANWWKHHFDRHPEHIIVHGHYFTISAIYFRIAHKYNRVTIGHSHFSAINIPNLKTCLVNLFLKNVGKHSDFKLACSGEAGEWLFPNKKYILLKNAINIKDFQYSETIRNEYRLKFNIKKNDIVLGTIGNFRQQKNPMGLIDIFKEVLKKNKNSKLVWIGSGPLEKDIKKRINDEHLNDCVYLTGSRSDVNKLLQMMDVFLLPSFYEGLGVALIEAQANGLRCFCSDRIPREVDVTGRCSFLPLNCPTLWADEISKSDNKRVDTQKNIIDAGYDIASTSKWLQEFYLNIIKDKRE